jgi:hypothetical protein
MLLEGKGTLEKESVEVALGKKRRVGFRDYVG